MIAGICLRVKIEMKHNVNIILVGLVLVCLVSMIGMVIYYRFTYKSLNERYWNARGEIDKVAKELNSSLAEAKAKEKLLDDREKKLVDIINELNLTKEKITYLGDYTTDLRGKTEDLESTLNKTMTEKERWAASYTEARRDLDVCRVDLNLKTTQLTNANKQLKEVSEIQIGLMTKADSAGDSVVKLKSKAAEIDREADDIENETLRDEIETDVTSLRGRVDIIEDLINDLKSLIEDL